jgi:hypothetical protein
MAGSRRKVITIGLISIILILVFSGSYLGFIPTPSASNVYFRISSNSSITGISISLVPEPPQCVNGSHGICDPGGPQCNLLWNYCHSINTQSNTNAFAFQRVKLGHYWLEFEANGGRGTARGIFVEGLTNYYVTANITAGLATAEVSITSAIL